jgi:hypothetical protein
MPYTAEISRTNPTCFVFLIDQSGSMRDPFPAIPGMKKADGVADAINRLLNSLADRCTKGEKILDRYFIAVIGYGATAGQAGPAFGGKLAGKTLVPISEVGQNPLRVEKRTKKVSDGAGGLVEQTVMFPIWFEPLAKSDTPMCMALDIALGIAGEFIANFPKCYPPMVINITDGEASDGDPEQQAAAITTLASEDGNVLLFNLHISSSTAAPVPFPDREGTLPDENAQRLFRMSSQLPAPMLKVAAHEGIRVTSETRGFVFNGDLVTLVNFLDIGTRVGEKNLR